MVGMYVEVVVTKIEGVRERKHPYLIPFRFKIPWLNAFAWGKFNLWQEKYISLSLPPILSLSLSLWFFLPGNFCALSRGESMWKRWNEVFNGQNYLINETLCSFILSFCTFTNIRKTLLLCTFLIKTTMRKKNWVFQQ